MVAAMANGDATMADALAVGGGYGAALTRALAAVTGGARDGNAQPAADADDSNVIVPCASSSDWRRPWYSQQWAVAPLRLPRALPTRQPGRLQPRLLAVLPCVRRLRA
jgi:hypothetical protein